MKKVLFTLALVALMLPLRAQITFPWTEDFEGTLSSNYTFIDNDNDGFNWEQHININDGNNREAHSGSGVLYSASWDAVEEALTPDNWFILPAMTLPANSDFELTWWAIGQDASYAEEHYAVYVATSNTVAAFTATTAVYEGESTEEYEKQTVSLANYAGQTIYIAFRHYNISDMFELVIDDIRVGVAGAPEISVSGPTSVMANTPATFVATGATTIEWSVDGAIQSETSNTLTYTFTTPGSHTVVASATNAGVTASATVSVNVYICDAYTDFPFTEDFENGLSECWTKYSADAANDSKFGIYADQAAHNGSYDFRFSSYSRATSGDYNQYLITPELNIGENNYDLKFWYKASRATDTFYVKASSTTNAITDFTTLASVTTPATAWTEMVVSLPAGSKYVAINYNANYQYYLFIDDLYIGAPTAPSVSLVGPETIKAGNTARYTATSTVNTLSWYVDGVAQSNTGNTFATSFTTPGPHTVVVGATNEFGTAYDTVVTDVYVCNAETLPFLADFTNGFGCWDTVSLLTHGYGWMCANTMIGSYSAYESYFGLMDIPVDNWIISNEIAMSAGNHEIAWMPFAAGAPAYAFEHYSVYVISGTNFADTAMVFTETLTSGDTTWMERVAAIPSTVTGNFKIAFRHHDSEGGYMLVIDSIQVRAESAPHVTVSGPLTVMTGATVTYTAISGNATSYAWTVDGTDANTTTNTLTTSFNTPGNHTVSVTATNNIGTSAPASLTVYAYSCDAITEFPWSENFEQTDVFDCWSFIDADGDGYNWDADFLRGEGSGHNNSDGMMASASYINNIGALTPDNWMILPAMALPQGSNLTLSWYEKGQDSSYCAETYSVYISTTGNSIADFTTAAGNYTATAAWTNRTIALNNYAGQTIYIAFRHYDVTDMYWLVIDDIAVSSSSTQGIESANDANVAIFPNPVFNMLNIEGNNVKSVEVIDMNGRVVINNNRAGQIDMSELSEGVYMVRVMSENGVSTKKIVKK